MKRRQKLKEHKKRYKMCEKAKNLHEKHKNNQTLEKYMKSQKKKTKSLNAIQIYYKLNKNIINHMICIKHNTRTQQPTEIM